MKVIPAAWETIIAENEAESGVVMEQPDGLGESSTVVICWHQLDDVIQELVRLRDLHRAAGG